MEDLEVDVKKLFEEARRVIRESRMIDKYVYRLAFIYLKDAPYKAEAYKILRDMVKAGLISEDYLRKVLDDVRRWKVLRYREQEMEYGERY